MAAAKVPGLSIAVIDQCEISSVSYFGVADIETSEPVGPETLFEAASLTKTIFSLIVNQLADEGVIDLDTRLSDTFAYPRIKDQEGYALLTPRIILGHRSGLPNWASDPADEDTWGDIPFMSPPDTEFGYSGEAYQLLQAYVEDGTGKRLNTLFEERLGAIMPMTILSTPVEESMTAFGHDEEGGKEKGREMQISPRAGAAFSGISNARDYASFLSYLCSGGGVSIEARGEMLRPQSPTDDASIVWGLGWGVQSGNGDTVYFHWGDNGQFKAFTAFNPVTRDGVVYFANGYNGLKLIEQLAEPVVGDLNPTIGWLDYGRLED
jgi:CubicO group peptidase (beta-lactamase class C family)